MESLIESCGVKLHPQPCLSVASSFVFVKNLNDNLSADESSVDEFVADFEDVCNNDDEKLVCFLNPCCSARDDQVKMDSLVQMLLDCKQLQCHILKSLLNTLVQNYSHWRRSQLPADLRTSTYLRGSQNPSVYRNTQSISASNALSNKALSIPQLIINHFMWINKVFPNASPEDESICVQLIKSCKEVSYDLQRSLLQCLPILATDKMLHDSVARELIDLAFSDRKLLGCVLDVMIELKGISSHVVADIRQELCTRMKDCDVEQLASLVKFCLESSGTLADQQEVSDLVHSVRVSLDCSVLMSSQFQSQSLSCSASQSQQPNGSKRRPVQRSRSSGRALLDVLHMQLIQNRALVKAWLDILEDKRTELVVLDLVVIIIMLHLQLSPKRVDLCLRHKIKTNQIACETVKDVFKEFREVTKVYGQSMLDLLSSLLMHCDLSSNEDVVVCFATCLFSYADVFTRQELVAHLITNVCVNWNCAHTIFKIFDVLISDNVSVTSLRKYSALFRGFFESIDKLNLSNIRSLFKLLTALSLKKKMDDSVLNDELFLIIKKYLKSKSEPSQKVAVVASFAVMSEVCKIVKAESAEYADKMVQEVFVILECLEKFVTSGDHNQLCLYFEEWHSFVEALKASNQSGLIEVFLRRAKQTVEVTKPMFLTEFSQWRNRENSFVCNDVKCGIMYGLSDSCGSFFDFPRILSCTSRQRSSNLALALPSFVKLFWICRCDMPMAKNSSRFPAKLKEITEMSVLFPEEEFFDLNNGAFSLKQLNFLSDCSLLLVNLLRELINLLSGTENFSMLHDKTMFLNMSARLKLLQSFQVIFIELLKKTLHYYPPGISNPYSLTDFEKGCFPLPHQIALNVKKGAAAKAERKRKRGELTVVNRNGNIDDDRSSEISSAVSSRTQQQTSTQIQSAANMSRCIISAPGCSTQSQTEGTQCSGSSVTRIRLQSYVAFLRETDLQIFDIFNPDQCRYESDLFLSCDSLLTPKVLLFLLQELGPKLKLAFLGRNEISSSLREKALGVNLNGFCKLRALSADVIAQKCITWFPKLVELLDCVAGHFVSIVNQNDGIVDCAEMFEGDNIILSECLSHLMQILHSILNWKGFKQPQSNFDLLSSFLHTIAESILDMPRLLKPSVFDLLESFNHFLNAKISESVSNIHMAVQLTTLSKLVAEIADETIQNNKCSDFGARLQIFEPVAEISEAYLKRKWSECFSASNLNGQLSRNQTKGSDYNTAIGQLASFYFYANPNPFRCIERSIRSVAKDILTNLNQSEIISTCAPVHLAAVTEESFPSFFKAGWNTLILFTKRIPLVNKKTSLKRDKASQSVRVNCMKEWFKSVKCLYACLKVAKSMNSRLLFIPIVSGGATFIQQFTKKAIPLLELLFKEFTVDVKAMLRNVRECSQDLQVICTHSKITNDLALMRNVPKLRKHLESLLYDIKAVFAYHGCLDQFSMVPLKNRALNGDEIFSQRDLQNESVVSNDVELSDDNDENEVANTELLDDIQSSQVLRHRDSNDDAEVDEDSVSCESGVDEIRGRNGPVLSDDDAVSEVVSVKEELASLDGSEQSLVRHVQSRSQARSSRKRKSSGYTRSFDEASEESLLNRSVEY